MDKTLHDLLGLDSSLWADIGSVLTCAEADTFADFLAAHGRLDLAQLLMKFHSATDSEGDAHHKETA